MRKITQEITEIKGIITQAFHDSIERKSEITIKTEDNMQYSFPIQSSLSFSDIQEFVRSGKELKINGILNNDNNSISEITEIWIKINLI